MLKFKNARCKKEAMKPTPPDSLKKPAASTLTKGKSSEASTTRPAPSESRIDDYFPIIGLGASAGGLEALENFLKNVPEKAGMAFIIIQHLDPAYKGMLPELLQRVTHMPVLQVKNRMKVVPNSVYVIPPNKEMSIVRGVLYLHAPSAPRGQRLPIDYFFRSLANDQFGRSVGIILSGMGSDGAHGVRAIKEKSGLVAAQEPASAKFDSMPRSAIATGLADIVAAPEELPAKLIAALHQHPPAAPVAPTTEQSERHILATIMADLREHTGHDFSLYKKSSVQRRIERRMSVHQIDKSADYAQYVHGNPQELDLLFKELLIGVTSFFRDLPVWACLIEEAIPALLKANPEGKAMRAWVVGCSSGEEAYSLAMAFKEAVEKSGLQGRFSLHIFATDLDQDAIAKARQGLYPSDIATDVTPERLRRFFIADGNRYRIAKEIREMVTFAPQDIILDSPFTKIDILTCRNLLIYLGAELHRKLMPLFHYSLNPDGILVLGSAETIGNFTHLFAPLESKTRIYRRVNTSLPATAIDFPTGAFPVLPMPQEKAKVHLPATHIQSLADQLLLQRFSPAAVLVNDKGDIIYISGRTGKYLEPAAGKANWNIHAMAREGLRNAIAGALYKASRQKTKVFVPGLKVGDNNDNYTIDLTVQTIDDPAALRGMVVVVFADVPAVRARKTDSVRRSTSQRSEVTELEEALRQAREENRVLREEMQATREELKSANEELQSNNEELQSTNEELTSSREEMQSMNEELQTINAELQSKVNDLSRTSNDMKNLLDSTDIATVFLDNSLHVRRFTSKATQIFKLIPADAGRPLSDLVSDLQYPELQEDALNVLRTLAFTEKQIATRDARWFNARIMPYRTQDNVIDGVVITFSDITTSKALEAELRGTMRPAGNPNLY